MIDLNKERPIIAERVAKWLKDSDYICTPTRCEMLTTFIIETQAAGYAERYATSSNDTLESSFDWLKDVPENPFGKSRQMQQTKGQRHMQEFTDSLYVPDLIQALQECPQSYKVLVMGCDGIGVYDITQIIKDERGFIELWTFNSRSCELEASDDPFSE